MKVLRFDVDGTVSVLGLKDDGGASLVWQQMRSVIGGYLEVLYLRPDLIAYIDEDGKSKCLPRNDKATEFVRGILNQSHRMLMPGDNISGVMLVIGSKASDNPEEGDVECSVPEDILQMFAK